MQKKIRKKIAREQARAAASIEEVKRKREAEGFVCKHCGRCCLALKKVSIYPQDIERWEKENRKELYTTEMLQEWEDFGSSGSFDNQKSKHCPFLEERKRKKYYCRISDTKPIVCQLFPEDKKHAKMHCDCPGYD